MMKADLSPGEKSKMPSDSPGKSQAGYRGVQHRNTPYPRRHPPPSSRHSNPRDNNFRENRYHHHQPRIEKNDGNQDDGDAPARDKDSENVVGKNKERRFNGRCKLYVGNVPSDMTDEEFKKMFQVYGETSEEYLSASRGFGFIKMETRHKAEEASAALDAQLTKTGRHMRVRIAAHNAAIKVKYLPQSVSNEMLEKTFSMFGDVERAVVIVDEKGRSTGEGIVEFSKKPHAQNAVRSISERIFIMTSQPRPISVEMLEQNDELGGLPEIFLTKTPELLKEWEKPPRFAQPSSFESEMGQKWKKLYQLYKDQEELLKRNFADEVAKLEADQETALMEQQTLMLRQDIQRRQEELRMLEEQTQNEIKRKLEMRYSEGPCFYNRNRLSSNPGLNQLNRHPDESRHRGPPMPDADLRRRPDDLMRRQLEVAKNSPNESPFGMDRSSERPSMASPLQPPPIPPGVRMAGLNILGNLGGPPGLGGMNNPGNLRMGILPRPPMAGAGHPPPLLMDPSTPMRPQQGMRFDTPQGLRPPGGNLFGLRPPANMGAGLAQGPKDSQGPGDHAEAKRVRRI